MSEALTFLIRPAIGLLIGMILFYTGFRGLKMKRLIENTPTSKIRSLAMGLVEVYGEALPENKTLKSPLSKTDCVYYSVNIEEYRNKGKHSEWVSIYDKQSEEKFRIKDETGEILVNPKDAQMVLSPDSVSQSGLGKDPTKNIMNFLTTNKIKYEGLLGINKTMRYTEIIIAPKDKLYVMGNATIDKSKSATSKGYENVIISKEKDNNIFYISDKPEKELLKTFNWQIILGIYLGGAMMFFCLITIIFMVLIS